MKVAHMSYTRFILSIGSGSCRAKVVSEVNKDQFASVIFMVKSSDLKECEVVAKTIASLSDNLINNFKNDCEGIEAQIREHQDWSEYEDLLDSTHYVYAYATPKNYHEWKLEESSYKNNLINHHIFYIGRGQNLRLNDHIIEAIDNLAKSPVENAGNLEIGKIRAIQDFLLLENLTTGNKLVRKVAQFYGKYANTQYAATEYFLINNWLGIYQLENLTRGDTKVTGTTCEWICRPRAISGNTIAWGKIVANFQNTGIKAATQGLKRELIKAEVNSEFKKFPLPNISNIASGLTIDNMNAIDNQTDAFYLLTLHNSLNMPLVHIHLKLSDKHTGVCINIRPLDGDPLKTFIKRIAGIFFSRCEVDATPHIKNPGDPYFKPCVRGGVNGRNDIWFDFRKPRSQDYDISNSPLSHATSTSSNQSLYSTLKLISDLAGPIT
jgi:hypothetical protein